MRMKYLEKIPKKTNKKTITFIKLESSSKFVRPNNFEEVESTKQISSTSDPTQELEDLLHRSWTLKPDMKKKKNI